MQSASCMISVMTTNNIQTAYVTTILSEVYHSPPSSPSLLSIFVTHLPAPLLFLTPPFLISSLSFSLTDMKAAAANPKTANDLKSKASLMAAWFEGSSCKCKDEEGLVKELTGASILQKSKCKHIPKLVKEELYFISLFLLFIFNELRFLLLN